MRNYILGFIVALSLVGLNCGSVPQTHYYQVVYEFDPSNADNHSVPVTLGVTQFSSDVLYEGEKIVYRQSPYEVQYYHYQQWIASPKRIVTEKVLKQYQASGAFARVAKIPSTHEIDYILSGKIQAFEEWDEGNKWFGDVAIEFTLLHPKTNEIVWESVVSERTSVQKKEPVAVVAAISESLNKVIKRSIDEITNHLRMQLSQQ